MYPFEGLGFKVIRPRGRFGAQGAVSSSGFQCYTALKPLKMDFEKPDKWEVWGLGLRVQGFTVGVRWPRSSPVGV